MGELLKKARVEFKRWNLEQIGKYINAFDATYEHIQQLEKKYKEKENTKEDANEKTTQEEAKKIFL